MIPNDEQLKEQLAGGPLTRNGFDERMRKRIEERIGDPGRRTRSTRRTVWRLPAAVLLSLTAVLFGVWVMYGLGESGKSSDLRADAQNSAAQPMAASSAAQPKPYALLIGLRQDAPQKDGYWTSTYRTVLVAHDGGRLAKAAEGNGLFVPHKQDFWKLDTVAAGGGRQAVRSWQARNLSRAESEPDPKIPGNRISERVLFAGNEYVSLQTTIRERSGGLSEIRQVKTIEQINVKSDDPSAEPHVRLREWLPDLDPALGAGEQWSIDRNPGQWVPVAYEPGSGDGEPLQAALPAQVVNPDALLIHWQQIHQIDPSASDAFMYGNLLGVVAGPQIRVYELERGTTIRQNLSFPLAAGETVVMIQWAEGSYVDKWIRELRLLARK